MSCTVISLGPMDSGPHHLRLIDGEEETTLPIQKATSEHRNYILGTWVKSYANTARQMTVGSMKGTALTVPPETYLANEPRVAEKLWDKCFVVTGPDGYTIHAWVCVHENTLYHIYVPPQLRSKGIATALIDWLVTGDYMVARPWPYKQGLPGTASFDPYALGRHV